MGSASSASQRVPDAHCSYNGPSQNGRREETRNGRPHRSLSHGSFLGAAALCAQASGERTRRLRVPRFWQREADRRRGHHSPFRPNSRDLRGADQPGDDGRWLKTYRTNLRHETNQARQARSRSRDAGQTGSQRTAVTNFETNCLSIMYTHTVAGATRFPYRRGVTALYVSRNRFDRGNATVDLVRSTGRVNLMRLLAALPAPRARGRRRGGRDGGRPL